MRWSDPSRHVFGLVIVAVLVAGAGCTSPSPTPPDTPAPSEPSESAAGRPPVTSQPPSGPAPTDQPEPVRCPAPTVQVATADELHQALGQAAPGDVIQLADGVYSGNFTATAAGTAARPVFLCGGSGAVLDAGGIKEGYVLHLDGAAYWRVVGITVRNGQKGVMADAAQHVVLQQLTVETTGDEAIHFRRASSDNVIRDSTVRDTGHRRDKFGEGIYLGTATSNWRTISNGQPDASNRNLVLNNTISATTAESIDVKEGTTGGVLRGNTFDGAKLSGADSWVDVKGSDYLVVDNTGAHSVADGFQTHEIVEGAGARVRFSGNRGSDLATKDPEGVLIGLHPDRDSVVDCDNQVSDESAPVSNVGPTACAR